MAHRIEVGSLVPDTRAHVRLNNFRQQAFGDQIKEVKVVDVYTINRSFSGEELDKIASSLTNPVTQAYAVDKSYEIQDFDYAIEVGFQPGVTDNIGNTAREIVEDLLKIKFENEEAVYTSQVTFVKGEITEEQARELGGSMANELIQRILVKSHTKYESDGGMDVVVPKVDLHHEPQVIEVDLEISDEELQKLGKQGIANEDGTRRGPLALDMDYLRTIQEHFRKLGRKPTDVELESLAQTWSEHCKHTIFAATMDDIKEGIYKHYIKRATNEIRATKGDKDFCVSVFKDNSGGIVFDDKWIVTDKAETHNSPSALDPFVGSITGIVGVNRDTIGFGKAAKPVINRYGFCLANPDDKSPLYKGANNTQKMLSPRRIMDGVIDGVNVGGNCSGIPTPQGFLYFDDRYKGKPLIFVGTVGLMPRELNGKPSWEKSAQPGDKVVVAGGKVGQDGIHGATFSSEAMDSGSPSTAVQIGDPITQKKMSDAIVKEARDMGLYSSITDCGAGGISCSVAEMARECGGCYVELDKVPLKYPGLDPWQTWISESQERMTMAIPPDKVDQFLELMERRGVDAWVIGEFNDSGKCEVVSKGEKIMDLELSFLHDGLPHKTLTTTYTKETYDEPDMECPTDLTETLNTMMARLNLASFDFISHQYDHVVQGETIVGPLHGKGRVNGHASVMAPVLNSTKGVVVSQAINAKYSDIDTYHMAACAIDSAIRNIISIGGPLDHMALMDNFCWCSSNEEERLGQLKEAARGCYEYSTAYGTPFISGKDSMFNDFKGYDEDGKAIKISVPPTLLISSLAVMDDYRKSVTLDVKLPGDLVYVVGETSDELGASEYFEELGFIGNNIPKVDADKNMKVYQATEKAIQEGLVASCESVLLGGLGVALARKAVAGQLGMDISLKDLPLQGNVTRPDYMLFSESQGRLVMSINPAKKAEFEAIFEGLPLAQIGTVREDQKFVLTDLNDQIVIDTDVSTLDKNYRLTFKGF